VILAAAGLSAAGQTWQRASSFTTTKEAMLIAQRGGLVLCDNKIAFHSADNGRTWTNLDPFFKNGVLASCVNGSLMCAFTPEGNPGVINFQVSDNGGRTWEVASKFSVPAWDKLVDVEVFGVSYFAYTSSGVVQVSNDGGATWYEKRVGGSIGGLVDLAVTEGMWVACGKEGNAWSANHGITWYSCVAPVDIGSGIHHVENYQGKIWGGGLYGAAEFDVLTRSWIVRNDGIPEWANLLAKPVSLIAHDNVLFAVFQTYDGYSSVRRWSSSASKWVPVSSDGLPRYNHAGTHQLACYGDRLFMYVHADDINYVGVYNARHDAPTDVDVIDVVDNSSIQVMPQPASDVMTIHTGTFNSVTLSLTDTQGRVIHSENVVGETMVNVSDVAPGTYMLRLIGEGHTSSRLVVVTR
jgi:hypothetical protein